jgi:hypothetical protein
MWCAKPNTTLGAPPHHSALTFATTLTPRVVFRLALCQIERLIGSVLRLLGFDPAVPDHMTLNRWVTCRCRGHGTKCDPCACRSTAPACG